MVADPLDAAGDRRASADHTRAPRRSRRARARRRRRRRFARSIRSSRSLSDLRLLEVAVGEGVERDADHLLGALAHVLERVEDPVVADVEAAHQLRQLRDGHAVVGHPLEVEVHAEHGEHEPQVARDRRLAGEQRLDAGLDREVAAVDLVVEADHLVGELVVAARERVQRRAERAQDEVALLLQRRLELLELVLERRLLIRSDP